MRTILWFFTSLHMALLLLAALIAASIIGTLVPQGLESHEYLRLFPRAAGDSGDGIRREPCRPHRFPGSWVHAMLLDQRSRAGPSTSSSAPKNARQTRSARRTESP